MLAVDFVLNALCAVALISYLSLNSSSLVPSQGADSVVDTEQLLDVLMKDNVFSDDCSSSNEEDKGNDTFLNPASINNVSQVKCASRVFLAPSSNVIFVYMRL